MYSSKPSPVPSAASDDHYDPIFPSPNASPWSSPLAFPSSPGNSQPSHTAVVKRCGKILSLALSCSGTIYAGTESKSVRVWKAPGFVEYTTLRSGSPIVAALVISPDGKLVFTAHSDCKIRVWNSDHPGRKGKLPSFKENLIQTWVTHPKSVFTWSTTPRPSSSKGSPGNRLKHSGTITSLAYNPATGLLYSASMDNSIKVWDVQEMKCIETIYAHDDAVNAVAVGPDSLLFSGSEDTTLKVWKREIENVYRSGHCHHVLLYYLQQHRSPVKAIVVSGDTGEVSDYLLYGGCADGCLYYWRKGKTFGNRSYLGCMRGHGAAVTCLAAKGEVVASGSADATVRVWRRSGNGDRLQLHCAAVLSGHKGPVKGVAIALERVHFEKSFMVYSGSLDGSVKQWWVSGDILRGAAAMGDFRDATTVEEDGMSESDYLEISLKGLVGN